MNNGWIGVDFDGTLAYYDGWKGPTHLGSPVPRMVRLVREWLVKGKDVRIFTARVKGGIESIEAIKRWAIEHLGQELPVVCEKDFQMIELWDDRAVQVIPNTGIRADAEAPYVKEMVNVLRRIAQRGRDYALIGEDPKPPEKFLDLFQHMLDEIERVQKRQL